jgi:hypothetical protein
MFYWSQSCYTLPVFDISQMSWELELDKLISMDKRTMKVFEVAARAARPVGPSWNVKVGEKFLATKYPCPHFLKAPGATGANNLLWYLNVDALFYVVSHAEIHSWKLTKMLSHYGGCVAIQTDVRVLIRLLFVVESAVSEDLPHFKLTLWRLWPLATKFVNPFSQLI